MAHNEQRDFIESIKNTYPDHFDHTKVVEMGSLDINGTVRDFFTSPQEYVGIDIGPGPGVDIVSDASLWKGPEEYFDVSISAECFEHNPRWRETFSNMVRVTRPSGLVIFTCAGEGRPEHGTTRTDIGSSPLTVNAGWEYYKNLNKSDFTEEDLKGLDYQFYYNQKSCDLYFVASKKESLIQITKHPDWKVL